MSTAEERQVRAREHILSARAYARGVNRELRGDQLAAQSGEALRWVLVESVGAVVQALFGVAEAIERGFGGDE